MKTILSFLSIFIMLMVAADMAAAQNAQGWNDADTPFEVSDDEGMSLRVFGDEEEEGAWKLFVKNATGDYALEDPTADDLNHLSPAAGIKFKFEF